MGKAEIPLAAARRVADKICEFLRVTCSRVEIAGSIRRGKPIVGDVEIVAISKRGADLFGNPTDALQVESAISRMEQCGALGPPIKDGDRYKQRSIPSLGCNLDLFLPASEIEWPVIFAIRTGPADFSRRLVTQRCQGGLLPDEHKVSDGRVRRWDGKPIDFASEWEFIEFCCGRWIEPNERA